MKRFRVIVVAIAPLVALAAVLALPAAAQIGPWSEQFPAWTDLDRDGVIDPGERTVYPEGVWNPGLPEGDPDRLYVRLVNNPWDACPGHIESRIYATPLLNPQTIARRRGDVTQTVTGTFPNFSFSETIPDPPAIVAGSGGRRVNALLVTASGGATFADTNGDGSYDRMSMSGQKGAASVPQTDLDFVYRDVNGDGRNDYVSFPWALTGALGVKTTDDCLGGAAGAPQLWLPLYDSTGDGNPDRVSVRFPDPSSPGDVGGLDGPLIGPSAAAGIGIPTASSVGLVAFAAALVAAGALLLRAPGTVGGA